MATRTIKLGTRGSDLARWQTNHVAALLKQADPHIETEIVIISTRGDRVLDTPLPLVGGKGVFTEELEAALRSGAIDLAVHSLKDLPTEDPAGLVIGAIPLRANSADVLVSRNPVTLKTLRPDAVIGTSSLRRIAQLRYQRPDLNMMDIRGNIDTRVRKALEPDSPYDAIVLADAGLTRLGMQDVISEVLSFEEVLPAPGQGALGIQCRDNADMIQALAAIHHADTALAVAAERGFLAGLGGGCSLPVGAYACRTESGTFELTGRVCALDGSQQIEVEISFSARTMQEAGQAGKELASQAVKQGAQQIMESV